MGDCFVAGFQAMKHLEIMEPLCLAHLAGIFKSPIHFLLYIKFIFWFIYILHMVSI